MSSYLTFWVKNKKGNITPLASFSRSTEIYQKARELGLSGSRDHCEDILDTTYATPYTTDDSIKLISLLESSVNARASSIKTVQDNIYLALTTSNSLEDKMEYVNDCRLDIEELQEDIETYKCYINYLNFIEIIREEQDNYDNTKDTILVGIDAVVEGEENVE